MVPKGYEPILVALGMFVTVMAVILLIKLLGG